jgi:hypothetical protein
VVARRRCGLHPEVQGNEVEGEVRTGRAGWEQLMYPQIQMESVLIRAWPAPQDSPYAVKRRHVNRVTDNVRLPRWGEAVNRKFHLLNRGPTKG